jgi:UDP-2,4-diacetamido-2,4,6-trideoxy-beta-L-altropyranose hydrolase
VKVALRADAYAEIGTGHLMRCIVLGQGIMERGGEVVFITYCSSAGLVSRLKNEGFSLHLLNVPRSLTESLGLIEKERPDWVVLDGYHFDSGYQKAMKDAGYKLLVIDDYVRLDYYYADIILNQNYGAEEIQYNTGKGTKLLLGTKYVMLRREFLKYREFERKCPEFAENVLITMGGADTDNLTLQVLKALNLVESPLKIKVAVGAANPHYEMLAEEVKQSSHSVKVLRDVQDMAHLIAWADIAVSAGGTTVWELAFMGLPSFLCIVATNQVGVVNRLARDGIFQTLGQIKDLSDREIAEAAAHLIGLRSVREEMCAKEMELVDGEGAKRVFAAMGMAKGSFSPGIFSNNLLMDIGFGAVTFVNFLNLSEEEKRLVLAQRNSDEIRSHMFNDHIISIEEHGRFIERLRNDRNNFYWIVKEGDVPIGVASAQRVDPLAGSCFLGIYSIRKGAGSVVLKHLLDICCSMMNINTIRCEVLADNFHACEFYRRNGFLEEEEIRFVEKNGSEEKVTTFVIDSKKILRSAGR